MRPSALLEDSNHELLSKINHLLNTTYHQPDLSGHNSKPLTFSKDRIQTRDQLVHELGPQGLICVAVDTSIIQSGGASDIVACASLKPYKGSPVSQWRRRTMENGRPDVDARPDHGLTRPGSGGSWEVATCASRDDPRYRGVGLVSRCVDVIVAELLRSRAGQQPVKLYVSALHESGRPEYWERRGFLRQGEPEHAPAGVWGSNESFRIATLTKVVRPVVDKA